MRKVFHNKILCTILTVLMVLTMFSFDDIHVEAACSHTGVASVTKAATCTSTGTRVVKCSKCKVTLSTSTIAALGHSYSTTKSATCGSAGSKKCSRCGATASIPATGNHSPATRTTSATCTSSGTKTTYCSSCGKTLSTSTIAALGHNYVVTRSATCGSAGSKKCSRCSSTVSIPATGSHSPATRTSVAATCTASGTKQTYCTTCGTVLSSSSIAALGHNYQTTQAADCGHAGTQKCSRCSSTKTIPATGNHNPTSRVTKNATCTENGTRETYCQNCKVVLSTSTIDKLGHNYQTSKAATCGDAEVRKCTRCSATTTGSPATGNHNPTSRVVKAATCTEKGTKETYCQTCNHVLNTFEYDALGHNYQTTQAADCGHAGTQKCSRCSATKTIPATGNHNPTSRVVKAATCTEKGLKETYCQTCNQVLNTFETDIAEHHYKTKKYATCGEDEVLECTECGFTKKGSPATGNHNPTSRVLKAATCTEKGLKETYCQTCNQILNTFETDLAEHHYKTKKYATCGEDEVLECTECGVTKKGSPATGNHNPTARVIKAATCTEKGLKETYCQTCNQALNTYETDLAEHRYKTKKFATCGEDEVLECTECGATKKGSLATGNHNPTSRVIKAATCEEKGTKETYCQTCNQVLNTFEYDELGHAYETTKIPTATEPGEETCKRCHDVRPLPSAANHNPTSRVIKEPTCTEKGLKEVYCQLCHEVLSTYETEPLGHKYNVVVQSTCGAEGFQKCIRCSHTEQLEPEGEHAWEVGADYKYYCAICGKAKEHYIRYLATPKLCHQDCIGCGKNVGQHTPEELEQYFGITHDDLAHFHDTVIVGKEVRCSYCNYFLHKCDDTIYDFRESDPVLEGHGHIIYCNEECFGRFEPHTFEFISNIDENGFFIDPCWINEYGLKAVCTLCGSDDTMTAVEFDRLLSLAMDDHQRFATELPMLALAAYLPSYANASGLGRTMTEAEFEVKLHTYLDEQFGIDGWSKFNEWYAKQPGAGSFCWEGFATNASYEVIGTQSAEVANQELLEQGCTQPPYKIGTTTTIKRLTANTKYVRVYDKVVSPMKGSWIMQADSIAGLSPAEIQEKFALPTLPKYICDVELEAGDMIREGIANDAFGFDGGGNQIDLYVNPAYVGTFSNERLLGND